MFSSVCLAARTIGSPLHWGGHFLSFHHSGM